MLGRIIVFKVVELGQAVKKVWLRGCRARIHKRNFTVGLLRKRGCREQKQQRGEEQSSGKSVHCHMARSEGDLASVVRSDVHRPPDRKSSV
jgi:hypothetical protein